MTSVDLASADFDVLAGFETEAGYFETRDP